MASSGNMPPGENGMPPVASDSSFSTNYRIGPAALTASLFTFLGIAVIVAGSRLFLRFRTFHRIGADDAFLIAAVILFAASCGVTQAARNLDYIQMDVSSGLAIPSPDFPADMLLYTKLNTAESFLQWSTIFAVKFSYMLFFRPLISRVRMLEKWWWIVIAVLIPSGLVSILMAFWVCSHYDMSFFTYCVYNGNIIVHERILIDFTTALDVATDLLIISIPCILLCEVRLELRRKLALGAVLCLSIFMIAIACVRFALCQMPTATGETIPDTTWLFFWQSMEACVAIVMVSVTAFRSLYGQEQSRKAKGGGYDYVNESSAKRNGLWRSRTGVPKPGHGAENWGEEELRVMDNAHMRDGHARGMWNDGHDRQASREKDKPSPVPNDFV